MDQDRHANATCAINASLLRKCLLERLAAVRRERPLLRPALAAENAELREQMTSVQDMLVETAIDAGNMHTLVEAMRTERDT